ncbi:MAG: TauD/TfdA family dioxygenase [Polyangiales bacterium]
MTINLSSPAPSVIPHVPATQAAYRLEPFSAYLGAVVHGIDLRQPLSAAQRDTLRRALWQHGVLFFRDQQLSAEQFLEATRTFGEPLRHNPYLPSVQDFSGVEIIQSGKGRLANESWHADVTWQHNPPPATALYAAELPTFGGDTLWASSTAAYESLDPLLRAYFDTLHATNYVDANGYSRSVTTDAEETARLAELRTKFPPIDVPVISTHPETGKKAIFVNQLHTSYIKGVTRPVSESLLRILFDALENPVLHARFRWAPGSVAIWDNRLVQHRAIHDYGDQKRVLYRVTLA